MRETFIEDAIVFAKAAGMEWKRVDTEIRTFTSVRTYMKFSPSRTPYYIGLRIL